MYNVGFFVLELYSMLYYHINLGQTYAYYSRGQTIYAVPFCDPR